MKKLLVAAIGAAAAFGAFADDTGVTPISTQRFQNEAFVVNEEISVTDLNTTLGNYWKADADATNNVYKVAAADPQSDLCPTYYSGTTKSLNIKTEFKKPLSVGIEPMQNGDFGSREIGTGLYFDSVVKFTVCDDTPTEEYDNAKIVVWLQATEDESQTNLYVKAAHLDYNGGIQFTTNTYQCQSVKGDFADKWHRVTIKAIADITKGGFGVPAFAVYVDKELVNVDGRISSAFVQNCPLTDAANYLNLAAQNALFPSLVQGDNVLGKDALKAASFAGTGYITDIIFTADPFDFAKDHGAPIATVEIDGGEALPCETFGQVLEAVNDIAANQTATLKLKQCVTLGESAIEFTARGTVVLDFAGFVLTNENSYAAITNSAANLVITNSVGKGGIYCTLIEDDETKDSACALYAEAGVVTINGGNFWGHLKNNGETIRINANAGAFLEDDVDLPEVANVPEGKNIVPIEGGLNEIVDKVYYWVTYDSDGGSVVANQQVESGLKATEPANPTKTGYTFAGWFAPEAESAYDFDTVVTGDITLTAHWTVNKYLVTFMNGVDTFATTNVEYNTVAVAPAPAPTKTGYTFNYWYTSDSAVAYDFDTPVTAAFTLNAKFTADTYTVTYNLDLVGATNAVDNIASYTIETAEFTLLDAGCEGYTFNGWTNTSGTVTAIAGGTTGDVTLYATWTQSGGGSIDPESDTVETTVTAASAEAAEAAAKAAMTVPTEAAGDKAAYADLFTYTTKDNGGGSYTVKLQDIKEEVKETVSSAAATALLSAADSAEDTFSVAVPAGLHYKVTTYDTLGGAARGTQSGISSGTTKAVLKPTSTTQGFIKVQIGTQTVN